MKRILLTDGQNTWIYIVCILQLLSGVALLLQVGYTWFQLRRHNSLIKFMVLLLILIAIKAVSLIMESAI